MNGQVISSFTDVKEPRHLSSDSEGHVLVADYGNNRILLLNSELQLQHILISDSQVKGWWPSRLYYNKLASQLYVIHSSGEWSPPDIVSLFTLR